MEFEIGVSERNRGRKAGPLHIPAVGHRATLEPDLDRRDTRHEDLLIT